MSESERRESGPVGEALDGLESAVERLIGRYAEMQRTLTRIESEHSRIKHSLRTASVDSMDARQFERRLAQLAEENEHLRDVIEEARERAVRIRGRLIVLEDEV